MGKLVLTALSTVAVLTLLAEGLAGGLLWSQGRLNPDAIREIRVILSDVEQVSGSAGGKTEAPPASIEDVIQTRAIRILHLNDREREQEVLRGLVADSRVTVVTEQKALVAKREQFEKEQQDLKAKTTAASIGLTRAVLLASDSKTAVAQLMKLSLEESVILLTEMPEKMIAKLLEAFSAGDKLQIERGHEIFQAIARGRIAETPGETLK